MARVEVVMPQMGESITTGTITRWTKAPGEEISLDEIILEISTDKVESEIPSPVKGRIEVLHYPEGETIDVGKVIAEIETDLSIPFSAAGVSKPSGNTAHAAAPIEASKAPPAQVISEVASTSEGRTFYTPLVKAMAQDHGISLSKLEQVQGTGAGGRINKNDLLAYINNGGAGSAAPINTQGAPSAKAPLSSNERVTVTPMGNMRKVIAKNMVLSKTTAPHVNSISDVDLTNLVKFREGFKKEFKKQEGFNLTYSHFIMYAIIRALKEFPLVNSSIDGDNIVTKKYINLGCAVAVESGLVVPNVKDAGSLNLTGVARSLNTLAQKARAGKLGVDDMSDGTFTFTNNGSFGTLIATPIILQPQVGIYCAGVIKKVVSVMKDDSLAIRSIMYGTHTYDHRLIDGAVGGNFLASIHRNLTELDYSSLF